MKYSWILSCTNVNQFYPPLGALPLSFQQACNRQTTLQHWFDVYSDLISATYYEPEEALLDPTVLQVALFAIGGVKDKVLQALEGARLASEHSIKMLLNQRAPSILAMQNQMSFDQWIEYAVNMIMQEDVPKASRENILCQCINRLNLYPSPADRCLWRSLLAIEVLNLRVRAYQRCTDVSSFFPQKEALAHTFAQLAQTIDKITWDTAYLNLTYVIYYDWENKDLIIIDKVKTKVESAVVKGKIAKETDVKILDKLAEEIASTTKETPEEWTKYAISVITKQELPVPTCMDKLCGCFGKPEGGTDILLDDAKTSMWRAILAVAVIVDIQKKLNPNETGNGLVPPTLTTAQDAETAKPKTSQAASDNEANAPGTVPTPMTSGTESETELC